MKMFKMNGCNKDSNLVTLIVFFFISFKKWVLFCPGSKLPLTHLQGIEVTNCASQLAGVRVIWQHEHWLYVLFNMLAGGTPRVAQTVVEKKYPKISQLVGLSVLHTKIYTKEKRCQGRMTPLEWEETRISNQLSILHVIWFLSAQ